MAEQGEHVGLVLRDTGPLPEHPLLVRGVVMDTTPGQRIADAYTRLETRHNALAESHAMLMAAVEQLCGHLEERPYEHRGCTDFGRSALTKARALVPEAGA